MASNLVEVLLKPLHLRSEQANLHIIKVVAKNMWILCGHFLN